MDENNSDTLAGDWVVLIDGNTACHATTRPIFADTHWRCLMVSDTLDGLCTVVEKQPRAVLVDEACTPLDPWQFSLLVKGHPRFSQTRIIVMCKRLDIVLQARARAAQVDGLLQKPFASDEMLALLEQPVECAA